MSDPVTPMITSSQNPRLKTITKLLEKKSYRYECSQFVLEGFRAIRSLAHTLSRQYQIVEIYCSARFAASDNYTEFTHRFETFIVEDTVFDKISDVNQSQGVLAIVSFSLNHFDPGPTGLYLLLDSLTDPGNMGTLIRSAVAAGFHGVLLTPNCVDPFNPKAIRASMGVFGGLGIYLINHAQIHHLKSLGYDIIVTKMDGRDNVFATTFSPASVLIVGGEATGVREPLQAMATRSLFIPMLPDCESLNAAVAGSLCMFNLAHNTGRLPENLEVAL